MFLILIEWLFMSLVLWLFMFEVALPALRGMKMFPTLRRRFSEVEEELAETIETVEERNFRRLREKLEKQLKEKEQN